MKKLIIAAAFILLAGATFGQTFQKGNLVSFHVITLHLNPDVTYNQWKNFMLNKLIPAFDKGFQGDIKMYIWEGERGDDKNYVSYLWIFKSVEVRDKYWPLSKTDAMHGTATELWLSKFEKINLPLADEASNLGTSTQRHYTDWVIQ